MRAKHLVPAIRAARRARRPVMLWGKPGVGKSSIIKRCAELDKVDLIDWRLALMDSVDLRGIPDVRNGMTYWNPPAELPRKGSGYLFIDELQQASMATGNAARQLILDRMLGEYRLPDGWYVCAASNREEDNAATQRMPTHIANSFIHLMMEVHHGDWLEWAEQEGIDHRVFAFIKYRPALLHVFDAKSKEKAFASPRSIAFFAQLLKEIDAAIAAKELPVNYWDSEEGLEFACGVIGQQAGTEMTGFFRVMNKLVSIDSILLNPKKAEVPSDMAICYALVYALAERADRKTLPIMIEYLARLSKEFAFLFFKRIDVANPDLKKSKDFIAWAAKHHDFI